MGVGTVNSPHPPMRAQLTSGNGVRRTCRTRDHEAMSTPEVSSPRISWADVPQRVRTAVDRDLGSPVKSAVSQHGGFSPGAAMRVVCDNGRRAFVKAVGLALNPDSPGLHRAEIATMTLLPDELPAPKLLASYDDGDWVALVLEDIDGRRPDLPWTESDATLMASSLGQLARTTAPEQLRDFCDVVHMFTCWDEVAAHPDGIDPALLARLPEMLAAQSLAREVTAGDALVHWDARADNALIRAGRAVLVDWAWASRGAPWLDTLALAMDFTVQGGPDPDDFLRRNEVTRNVPPAHLRAVLETLLGMFAHRARSPAPPGLPTIRQWQAHCRDRVLRWVDEGPLWN
jgi:hypothetical protein